MNITKEAIREILDEEIAASVCECALGAHAEVHGRDGAVNRLYDLFMEKTAQEPPLKTFIVYWRDGKKEVLTGRVFADALTQAGYGMGALNALDFYDDVGTFKYTWNETTKRWDKA